MNCRNPFVNQVGWFRGLRKRHHNKILTFLQRRPLSCKQTFSMLHLHFLSLSNGNLLIFHDFRRSADHATPSQKNK